MGSDNENFWNDVAIKKHIADYQSLLASDADRANIFFAEHLYPPFAELIERVHAKKDFTGTFDVQDVKQDVLLIILRELPKFDTAHECKALTFFWKVATNYILNAYKKHTRKAVLQVDPKELVQLAESDFGTVNDATPFDSRTFEKKRDFFLTFWTPERLKANFRKSCLRTATHIVELVRAGRGMDALNIAQETQTTRPIVYYVLARLGEAMTSADLRQSESGFV